MEVNNYRFGFKGQQRFPFFLASDLHLMNLALDEKRLKGDLDQAKNEGARIYLNGDIFDMILPSDIKRYTRAGSKYDVDPIINEAVKKAVEYLAPYVDYIDLMGVGNHDTAPIKYHSVDPVAWLISELNRLRSEETIKKYGYIRHGGYTGFIRLTFSEPNNGHVRTFDIFYNHGQGGASEVTKGSIDLQRRQYIAADLIWLGHKHTRKVDMLDTEVGLDRLGGVYEREKMGVITGCYLNSVGQYDIEKTGYHLSYGEEKMRTPQSKGGVMLYVTISRESISGRVLI